MEKSIKGTRTEQNLLKAFAGESQARSRYVFFASKAKKEGYEQIAGVFAETAEQEKEHAERFFKFLEGGDVEITASYPTGRMTYTLDPVPVWVAMPGYRIVPPEVGDTMALPAAYSLFRKDVAEMLDQVYK
nr:rubrerythrin family protein [Alistipes finegoldii]